MSKAAGLSFGNEDNAVIVLIHADKPVVSLVKRRYHRFVRAYTYVLTASEWLVFRVFGSGLDKLPSRSLQPCEPPFCLDDPPVATIQSNGLLTAERCLDGIKKDAPGKIPRAPLKREVG